MTCERIRVSDNGRFLVTESGKPFFWLGDTAWELFHRLGHSDAEHYLQTRKQQGYNVIQAVALAEEDGLHTPNVNGHVPLLGDDPARPNEFYFRHVDDVIRMAAERDMYIALLPTWGDKVHGGKWGIGPVVFTVENARIFGRYLGERYRDFTNVLWVLGGDRPAGGYEALWTAMADGITEGAGRKDFMTYHPMGRTSSGPELHEQAWLDMNMLQSGHARQDEPTWDMIAADYNRTPVKPVLDGEPCYEHHPMDCFRRQWKPDFGRYSDHDCRKQAYRAVFAGACGHTYGSHSIWQFWTRDRKPKNFAMPTWDEALLGPGARQMIHVKNLMLSRPYLCRIPAQDMLPDVPPTPPMPQDADDRQDPVRASHAQATRCKSGAFTMVYFPQASQSLRLDLSPLPDRLKAWWYDPRTGTAHDAGDHANSETAFTSPIAGPDWVLVLDDATKNFPAPGSKALLVEAP